MLLSLSALVPLLLLSTSSAVARTPTPRSYDTHTYYALELPEQLSEDAASEAAAALGAELVEPLGELAGHWLVRRAGSISARSAVTDPVMRRWKELRHAKRSKTTTHPVRDVILLEPKQRVKRVPPRIDTRSRAAQHTRRDDTEFLFLQNEVGLRDPILGDQWHLANREDSRWELNVTKLWKEGVTGKGVKVAVIDDGIDMFHDDIKPNYYAEGSWDYNDHNPEPSPKLSDDQHGTRCAGEIAAAANDACGVGVAYEAQIAGLRILSGAITDADEAAALNYNYQQTSIYSCSWGPPDNGHTMEAPDGLILKAMVNGVQKGRGGKGSLFVFAAGNGGGSGDQCNFDGYTNSIFSLTVGAIDHQGNHPYYSERCAAMMIVAPSSGSGESIHTTDVKGRCTGNHGGTSAAAPLMAGVLALALQVRDDLSWRDVQHLAINTAVVINAEHNDWEATATGRKYSYTYGYGKIDAGLFVEAARTWKLVKPQAWFDSPQIKLPYTPAVKFPEPAEPEVAPQPRQAGIEVGEAEVEPIKPVLEALPEGSFLTAEGVTSSFEVTKEMLDKENFETLEHVTVRLWAQHTRRGDVEVTLESPNGIKSMLAERRSNDYDQTGFDGWKFMSLKHWGENPIGTWKLTVRDQGQAQRTGRFNAWGLQLWGESIDPAKISLWSPAEEGRPDEELTGSWNYTATTTVQKIKPTALLPGDHAVVTGSPDEPTEPTQAAEASTTTADEGPNETDTDAAVDQGIFDGIDTLRSHSAWLAGAFLIVLLAALSGGGYFLYRTRKRAKALGLGNERGGYAPVGEEEIPLSGLRRPEESKELYDAFGDGPSDSEEEGDERTALKYHESFLDDDDEHQSAGPSRARSPPVYRDSDDQPRREGSGSGAGSAAELVEGSTSGSGSWQDAADDMRPDESR